LKTHLVAEGFPRTSVAVIYNGIDVGDAPSASDRARIRQTLGVGDDTLVVGTVARLDPVKDLGTLIEAAGHLASERRLRTVILGDGSEMSRLKQAAAARGISSVITFLGHRDDARSWLAGFDVFVNCSTSEGISLTILEAMAAGLPVVATAVGGTPEVVTNDCGYLVPPRDPVRLADAVRRLSRNADERQSLGTLARQRIHRYFQLERMISEYELVYRDAVRSGPAR
jgi:glycosyltransferase involved in cell wall biosynthesis